VNFVNGVSTLEAATLAAYCAETKSLDVTDGNLASGDNYDLDLVVNPANANYISYSIQPSNTVVNLIISPAIVVRLYDLYDNLCTNDSATQVTVTIATNPSGGTLIGTTIRTASSGIVTFNDLSIDAVGIGYTLRCSSGIIIPATSNSFRIMAVGVASWVGNTSNDWNTASNWDIGFVPTNSYDIIIEDSTYDPILDSIRTIDDLTINAGAILDLNAKDLTLTGSLTNNGTLQGANIIYVAGNWTNNGVFTAGSSTVIFNGAGESTISGSTTFYNFTCVTPGKQLTFEAESTQTIEGTLTLVGDADDTIILRSSEEGTQWEIDPQGDERDVDFVDVQDSKNIDSRIINPSNSIDKGNNTNWFPCNDINPPEPPKPPDPEPPPEPPKPPEDPDENVSLGGGEDLVNVNFEEGEGERKYKKLYAAGKYRTVVIVFEGKVIVCPYDETGIKCEGGKYLTDGEKTEYEGEIK